jgi:hypothetical protein
VTHGIKKLTLVSMQYTKDLMVEETSSSPTSSPQLSFSSSPASSPLAVDLYAPQHRANTSASATSSGRPEPAQPIFSLPQSRARVGSSSSSSFRLPAQELSPKQRAFASRRQPKRKRSISDSLVPTASRRHDEAELDADELFIEESYDDFEVVTRPVSREAQPRVDQNDDDDESDGFVESGEEDDDDAQPDRDIVSSQRNVRLQGHESGPPSPPANYYQHGSTDHRIIPPSITVTNQVSDHCAHSEREP